MMRERRGPAERGMTLIEMLIAIAVFGVVAAGALTVLSTQSRAFRRGAERLDVVQNLRFAAGVLEKELRTLGANVPVGQPYLVYAGQNAVAFHADYATNQAADPWAVYYDPDLPTGAVTTILPGQQITIPTGAFQYPAMTYTSGAGTNSPAELIIFYFSADASTARGDDFQLLRQVNNLAPEVVARHLLQTPGQPFFQYMSVTAGPPPTMQQVPNGSLPLAHTVPVHLGPVDIAPNNAIDAIRGVRVSFTATNGLTDAGERQRVISRLVRMPNAPFTARRQTCGDNPLNGTGFAVALGLGAGGEPLARLTWNPSTDEGNGENDVRAYTIWRRIAANPDWGDPYLSIPAGLPNYVYDDFAVTPGDIYYYAIAVQDCTPSLSVTLAAGPVVIP
jgi:prepilin-type N-terminal cleavage/methylation domain-containing protein